MLTIDLPDIGTDQAWRDAARTCLAQGLRPEDVLWRHGDADADLFGTATPIIPATNRLTVPTAFVDLASAVVWHRGPERFAHLYALLWRLKHDQVVMDDRADVALAHLRGMEKAVRRAQHKMKAFVRFREIDATEGVRRRFAAWFEPDHYVVEPTAPFFARRFADMDWCIVTPDRTARFENGRLSFEPGQPRPPLPEDAAEALWSTYFRNIFNPARLKVQAMRAEMPKKYWRNLPEAREIPELIAGAEQRARAMREAAPTAPPPRVEKIRAGNAGTAHQEEQPMTSERLDEAPSDLAQLRQAASGCTRCPLYQNATQVVVGEGPPDAELMLVGEQPGDYEDLAGRPFVGPAGQLLDEVCQAAGVDRASTFVTNAVKHFKFIPRGKRRLHQKPTSDEIAHCKWWLDHERELVWPRLIVALGATAAEALTGTGKGILKRRGHLERVDDGTPVFITIHPSYLLRLPDAAVKAAEIDRFRRDLEAVFAYLQELRAA